MKSKLNPYMSFDGNAAEAMDFYKTVFGGKLTSTSFKEGGMSQDPSQDNRVMHAELISENDFTIMASDTPPGMDHTPGSSISISLSGDNHEELSGYFNKLAEGGAIVEPLVQAPWGDTFGILTDKFGIAWMVNIQVSPTA